MIWFLVVLVIFWKPIYYLGMFLYYGWKNPVNVVKENEYHNKYKNLFGEWFKQFWSLLKP